MVLLDTNVLSELMRPQPAAAVIAWMDDFAAVDLWLSAVTVGEIRLGLALLPDGKRRATLEDLAERMFQEDFDQRCLPFDCTAALHYADIVSSRTRQGRPISVEDAQTAAIARCAGLTLATRNTKDFAEIHGLALIDPWSR